MDGVAREFFFLRRIFITKQTFLREELDPWNILELSTSQQITTFTLRFVFLVISTCGFFEAMIGAALEPGLQFSHLNSQNG